MLLNDLLSTMPDSVPAIAEKLMAEGVTGQRGNHCYCPIAEYLRQHGIDDPYVTAEIASCYRDTSHAGRFYADLPLAVTEFVEAFDSGCFPELISDREDKFHPEHGGVGA